MTTENNVHYSLSLTKNLGNYNSLKIECGYGRSLGSGEDTDEVFEEVWQKVNDQIELRLAEAEALLAD